MDIWVLDQNFRNVCNIDTFESLIWTERYVGLGNFELYTMVDMKLLEMVKQDYYVWLRNSEQVMIVESIQIQTEVETGGHLTISGRSLESILDRRIVWKQTVLDSNVQTAVQKLLNENAINPSDSSRKIPGLIFETTDDPAVTGKHVQAQYTGDNLYDTIEALCLSCGIGFKITLNANNQFVFKLYAGVDHSYGQSTNPYVIFSPKFENIINSNYLESKKTLKNITLVAGEDYNDVRRTITVGSGSGLVRRELYTDARDIQSEKQDKDEMVETLNFSTTTMNGVTLTNIGEGKAKLTGTPTAAGFTMSVKVKTIDSVPKGVYRISGCPSDNDKYHYTISVAGMGTSSDGKDVENIVVDSTKTNVDVTVTFTVDAGVTDFYDVNSTFTPQVTFYELHIDDYNAQLTQRGKEKLAENPVTKTFEGQVEATHTFVYGEDFYKGDIVQIVNEYGIESTVRVTEVVRCQDTTGYEMYPTFSIMEEEES